MQRIKAWLKLQNERGRHVAVGSVLRWILSLYRFHPRERFVNGLKVKYKTTTGTWRRLSFERSTLQRVFHVCLENTPDGRMVAKFPRGDNSYSCDFIQAVRSDAGIQNYRDTLA